MQLVSDLKNALQAAQMLDSFRALPPSHQRAYITWINDAKRSQTRASRIAKTCLMVAKKSDH